MQTSRAYVALGKKNQDGWEAIRSVWIPTLPEAVQKIMNPKLDGYKGGYGSVFVFEDQKTLEAACAQTPQFVHFFSLWQGLIPFSLRYAIGFRTWSENSTGMLQSENFLFFDFMPISGLP